MADDGKWLVVCVVVLEGKMWQLIMDPKTLDHDCKLWLFDIKSSYDLEWDLLEV